MKDSDLKLMIVDDSNIIRRRIERACNTNTFNIIGKAGNGIEALEIAKKMNRKWSQWILQCPKWTVSLVLKT